MKTPRPTGPRFGVTKRQKEFLDLVAAGMNPESAKARVGITKNTWSTWRSPSAYPDFVNEYNLAFEWGQGKGRPDPPDFVTFRQEVLGLDTPPHQQAWVKHLLDCDCKQLLILTFPEAGKTTLIGRDLPAYMFAKESAQWSRGLKPSPNRIAYISGTAKFAMDVGWQLQRLLTDRGDYEALWKRWGPFREEGHASRWSQSLVYMKWRDAGEKDPSIQWLGYSNQIQGKRITLAIMDDVDSATMGNSERDSILRILYRVILQRLGSEGKLVMIGNRQDDNDIYSRILENAFEAGWHVVVQTAVDEFEEPRWDRYTKDYFDKKRLMVGEREFNLVYQQKPTPGEGALFNREDLDACRIPGLGLGEKFDAGLTIVGLDPAVEGPWACCVASLSSDRKKFRLLDLRTGKGGGYSAMKETIEWAMKYKPHYFAIVKQGGLALFVGPEIKNLISKTNSKLELLPTTLQGLTDSVYGLSALSVWFGENRVEIPWQKGAAQKFRPLLDELEFYHPDQRAPKDRMMALWFAFRMAITKAPALLPAFGGASLRYPWLKAQQHSIPLQEMEEAEVT